MKAEVERPIRKCQSPEDADAGLPQVILGLIVRWADSPDESQEKKLDAFAVCQHIKDGDELKFRTSDGQRAAVLCEERPGRLPRLYTDKDTDTPARRYLEELP